MKNGDMFPLKCFNCVDPNDEFPFFRNIKYVKRTLMLYNKQTQEQQQQPLA